MIKRIAAVFLGYDQKLIDSAMSGSIFRADQMLRRLEKRDWLARPIVRCH